MKPNRHDTQSQQTAAEDALFRAVISLKSASECRSFFRDLCTPAELQATPGSDFVRDFIAGQVS